MITIPQTQSESPDVAEPGEERGAFLMATFVLLANFTDQGIRNIKDTIGRAEAFQEMAKKSGIAIKQLSWSSRRHCGFPSA